MVVVFVDLGRFKPFLEAAASVAIGQEVSVDGDLSVLVGGHVRIKAANIRIEKNVDGVTVPTLQIGGLSISVATASLVRGPLRIDELKIKDVSHRIDTTIERIDNSADEGSFELPELKAVSIDNVRIDIATATVTEFLVVENATLDSAEGDWLVRVSGTLNGEPLHLNGRLGPFTSIGHDEHLMLTASGDLGRIDFTAEASTESATTFALPRLRIAVEGGDAAYLLGLLNAPGFTDGPLKLDVSVGRDDADQAIMLRADGQFGEFSLAAEGNVDQLVTPESAALIFKLSGPSLKRVGQMLGVESAPDASYKASGSLRLEQTLLQVEDFRLDTADMRVVAAGQLGRGPELADSNFEVAISGQRIGSFATLLGIPDFLEGSFEANARLVTDRSQMNSFIATARVGEIHAKLSGDRLPLSNHERSWFALSADGPDLAIVVPSLEGRLAEPLPFSVTGNVDIKRGEVLLDEVRLVLGDTNATLTLGGKINTLTKMATVDLNATSEDMAALLARVGVETDSPSGASVSARVTASPARVDIEDLDFTVAEGRLRGTVGLKTGTEPLAAEFDVTFDKLSLSAMVPATPAYRPADLEVNGAAKGAFGRKRIALDKLHITVGDATFDGSGAIDLAGNNLSSLNFDLRVPDFQRLGSSERFELPSVPGHAKGELSSQPGIIRLSDTELAIGRSSLSIAADYRVGERPSLELTVDSPLVDLTEWIAARTARDDPDDGMEPGRRAIPDVAFPVDLLESMDATVSIELREAIGHYAKFSGVRLRAALQHGALTLDEFGFDSSDGSLESQGSYAPGETGRELKLKMTGRDMRLLGPIDEGADQRATRPTTAIDLSLSGTGGDLRTLLAGLDARIAVEVGAGSIPVGYETRRAHALFGNFGLEFLGTLNPFSKPNDDLVLDCAVILLTVDDGVVIGDPLAVVRTESLSVFGTGNVDLETEAISLYFNTQLRKGIGVSVGSVVHPFTRVGGTLAEPALEIHKRGAFFEGGAAIATGGLTALAKGLHGRFLADKDPCTTALEKFQAVNKTAAN